MNEIERALSTLQDLLDNSIFVSRIDFALEVAIEALQDRLKLMNKPLEGYQETLRKAREEVQKAFDNYKLVDEHEYDISEHLQIALAEIDKAIGDETGGKRKEIKSEVHFNHIT